MPNRTRTLILANTDPYVDHMLDFALGGDGYKLIFTNSSEVVDRCREHHPHAIVLGIAGRNYTSVRELRKYDRGVPIIAVNSGSKSYKTGIMKSGATTCVQKPFKPSELIEAVRTSARKR